MTSFSMVLKLLCVQRAKCAKKAVITKVQDGDIMFSNSMSDRHLNAVGAKQERRKSGEEYFVHTLLRHL